MEAKQRTPANRRLEPKDGQVIDRSHALTFTFEGKSYPAHPGDTIASALAASGVTTLSRSFKYHRPRGILCASGHCPNCLVQVGLEPNVRACMRAVEDGMQVKAQNAWPSLDRDVMSLTQLGDEFLPAGFYYKTFIRPKALWPTYEHFLRRAAGLGQVDLDTPWDAYNKQYLHTDVLVIGAGPAGLQACLSAAAQGAQVLLFDENPEIGGHLRFTPGSEQLLDRLTAQVSSNANVRVFTSTTVLGWWEENWISAVRGNRLYKIRAQALVVAAGAYEQPLVFDNNDLPGVLLGSAVRRLLHLYGVLPGTRAAIVTANNDGWQIAAELQDAGVAIAAVIDERAPGQAPAAAAALAGAGVPVYWQHTIAAAQGDRSLKRVLITPIREEKQYAGMVQRVDCDLLVVSVAWAPANGLLYQAGAKLAYDQERAEFLPQTLPGGIFAAGRAAGSHEVENQIEEGRLAGEAAAACCGHGQAPGEADLEAAADRRSAEPVRTSDRVQVKGWGKQFLCFCEDVTDKDLKSTIEEGYDSIELLKRYSTVSMGPCQGKMCSLNTIHLCARANGRSIEQTGTTTARPPMTPVKLGVLAGQNMEPVRVTPVQEWHLQRGARMMVAGLWMRPEHYGDPIAEVRAVRQRVGLIDVSTLGKMKMTGPGVPELLNKMYINKWLKLPVGRVRYGVMCNDEGVVLDDGVTGRLGELEWYTTTTSSGAGAMYEWIQWWAQSGWGEGLHITNVSEDHVAYNLAGPLSRQVLQKLTGDDVSNQAFGYMNVRQMQIAGVPCKVFRIGFTGELSYEIHGPSAYGLHLWQAIMDAGAESGILPFGVEAQRVLRLEKAHIIVGQDTDALSDPISADMAWAVKHDKPNFLGNRPLARVAKEGPQQKLVGFKMINPQDLPEEGLQIVTQKVENGRVIGHEIIGWVTSSRLSPTLNQAIGLCWLPAGLAEQEGAIFTIRMNGRLVEGRVHHGAFYDPEGTLLRT